MALPEQIRKQTEAVQELYKQLNGDGTNGEEQNSSADGGTPPAENTNTAAAPADENSATNNAAQSSGSEHTADDGKGSEEKSKLGQWTDFYRNATDEKDNIIGEHESKNIKLKIKDIRSGR